MKQTVSRWRKASARRAAAVRELHAYRQRSVVVGAESDLDAASLDGN